MVNRSNLIPGGAAKKIEGGRRVMLMLPDDVHEYIKANGGSKYLVQLIRAIKAARSI